MKLPKQLQTIACAVGLGLCCQQLTVATGKAQTIETDTRSEEVRLIDGLRERRLFRLARAYAAECLSSDDVTTNEKVQIAVADLQTLAQVAMQSTPDLRLEKWNDFNEAITAYARQFQGSNRLILVDVQEAIVIQARVELTRQELEAEIAQEKDRQLALELIQTALRKFGQIDKKVGQLLANRSSPSQNDPPLSAEQLLALRYNIQYQLARTNLNRALLYPAGDDINRGDALIQVERRLSEVLQLTNPDQPIWWIVQSERLAAARVQGQFSRAADIIRQLPNQPVPDEVKYKLQSEMMLLLIAQGKLQQAAQMDQTDHSVTITPELDLTRLRLMVAMSNDVQKSESQRSMWQNRAVQLAKEIELQHGAYWGRRANIQVIRTARVETADTNIQMLIMVADDAQRKGLWDDAIEALEAAAKGAEEQGKPNLAFRLGYRAGTIYQQQEKYYLAAEKMQQVADFFSAQPDAHTVHLLACWNLAQSVGRDATRLARYEAMLNHNIVSWPQSPSADQARLWLARLYHQQGHWNEAITTLIQVPESSGHITEAVAQLDRTLSARHSNSSADSYQNKNEVVQWASDYLVELVFDDSDDGNHILPSQWTTVDRVAATLIARLVYRNEASTSIDVTGMLESAVEQAASDDAGWIASATAWVLVGQARKGTLPEQLSERVKLVVDDEAAANDLLYGLSSRLSDEQDDASRKVRQTLIINAYEAIQESRIQFDQGTRKSWTIAYARAQEETGKADQAIDILTQLAGQLPNDVEIQLELAELLTRQARKSDNDTLQRPIDQWRRIAKRVRSHTPIWFEAKYRVAQLLHQKGETDAALELLNYLQAVPPGWTNSELAPKFNELLRNVQNDN